MTSKHFAVLGSPIEHSLSPAIHRVAYNQLGLDWTYGRFDVHSGNLASFLDEHANVFSGLSITMPLKIEAANIATDQDAIVQQLGVANTLLITDQRISAFNTDVFGISKALTKCWQSDVQNISILGAGATARSALMAVHFEAPKAQVTVYARSTTNTEPIVALAQTLDISLEVGRLEIFGLDQDLTINTLPADAVPEGLAKQQLGWLLDVNYAHQSRSFVETFEQDKTVSGKAMLLWQAIAQIRLFTANDVSVELPDEAGVLQAMTLALQ